MAPEHFAFAAKTATRYMDCCMHIGPCYRKAADLGKIATFRKAMSDTALTLASGITPENAADYGTDVDGFLVARASIIPEISTTSSRPVWRGSCV